MELEKKKYIGKIVWFSPKLGYGFLADEDAVERFFHYSALSMEGFKSIEKDTVVSFELDFNAKGEVATNIERV